MRLLLLFVVVGVCFGEAPIGRSPFSSSQEGAVRGKRNTCQYYSTDADMNELGLLSSCSNYCSNYFGQKPDGVNVNVDDGEPYKCCSVAMTQEVNYGPLNPLISSVVLINSTYICSIDGTTKTYNITTEFHDKYDQQTTTIVDFQEDIYYEIAAPEIFQKTFNDSYGFYSHEKTHDQGDSTVYYEDTTTINAQKGCTYIYTMSTTTQQYNTNWYVPICLSGYCRCNYDKPIEDPNNPSGGSHYLWYVNLMNFAPKESQRCINQKGTVDALMADITAQSTLSYSPPSCAPSRK